MSEEPLNQKEMSRRNFVMVAGAAVAGLSLGGLVVQGVGRAQDEPAARTIAPSEGYILVDTEKCAGCVSCMLACSLVHEGRENLSLSRIQVTQNPFERFPDDVVQHQCRQCVFPACVEACPTGALHVDAAHGNVRTVDEQKCIGCQRCIEACPLTPARPVWNYEEKHAQKCDLCVDTPYWDEKGGPGGKQACVEVCPMQAIAFTNEIPTQYGDGGYEVNLRNEAWGHLGFPTS